MLTHSQTRELINEKITMKTAVTHIQEKLEALGIYTSTMREIIEYAKREEEQQIIESFNRGTDWALNEALSRGCDPEEYSGREYFKETFNLK